MRSMTKTAVEVPVRPRSEVDPRVLALAATILVMPFPRVLWASGQNSGDFSFQTYVFPVDAAFAALLIFSIRPLIGRIRSRSVGLATAAAGLLWAALVVALAFHPSGRGVLHLFRFAGVIAAADTLASLRRSTERTVAVGALVVTTGLQAMIAVLQRFNGGSPLGLFSLGEQTVPWTPLFGGKATYGTMVHAYVLAALGGLTVAICIAGALRDVIPRRLAFAGVVAGAVPMAITYSRMSVLAVVGLAVTLTVCLRRRDPRRGLAARLLLALAIGALVPAAVSPGPWLGRAGQSSGRTSEDISTGRVTLMHQSLSLLAKHPLTGVGPGRYSFAVRDDPAIRKLDSRPMVFPVHNVPLLIAAEGGILAVLAILAVGLALGWQTRRGGVAVVSVLLGLLPFILLDHLNWTYPQGLLLLGLWLGAVDAIAGSWTEPAPD
jgi:hypothetical protein